MFAFVDESVRGSLVSVGFYVSKSYVSAFEALMRAYKNILRRFSGSSLGEIKFSTVLNIIGKRLGVLPNKEIVGIFMDAIMSVGIYGYGLAVIMNREAPVLPKVKEDVEYIASSMAKIKKLMKAPRYNPPKKAMRILGAFLFLLRLHADVRIIVVDHNFIRKKDLKFLNAAMGILGYKAPAKYCSDNEEKGILLADFIAGIAKHIQPQYRYGLLDHIVTFSIDSD